MASKLISTLLLGLLFVAGCQQESARPAAATALPRPNFDGPVMAKAPAVNLSVPKAAPSVPQAPVVSAPGDVPAAWIPWAPANHWQWIVIHHSATPIGSAAIFDREHRAKGWDELGYHFVIGNGTYSGDGQVEVGSRWPKQKWGAHAKTADNRYNDYGIGICLVGNFDIDRPTPAQLRSLTKLVSYLMETYHIPASHVIGHCDTKATDCPGRNMHVAQIRSAALHRLAGIPEFSRQAAAGELLHDAAR